MPMLKSENIAISIGFFIWTVFSLISLPTTAFSLNYVQILILAAPLWLIPSLWQLLDTPEWIGYLGVPAGVLLAIGFLIKPSILAALFSIPWLLLTTILAGQKLNDWGVAKSLTSPHLCHLSAYLFLPIGAAWAFADRLGFQPLDFDATIVLLTAAHFHYAGFILPTIAAFALPKFNQKWNRIIAWAVILGIPLVAIGITGTHLDLPTWIEVLAVTIMVFGGFSTGLLHSGLGWKNLKKGYGKLWLLAGLALMAGMLLALGYGWRHYYLIPTLTIPWMYAVHGTLNAVGFAVPAILGWTFYVRSNRI